MTRVSLVMSSRSYCEFKLVRNLTLNSRDDYHLEYHFDEPPLSMQNKDGSATEAWEALEAKVVKFFETDYHVIEDEDEAMDL